MATLAKVFVCFAFLSGIALGTQAVAPDAAPQASLTVTLDAPGWSLSKICEAISKQIGTKIEAHGDCVTDHLIVKVNNVPWSVLKEKLAWAEYGHWQTINKVLTLERDPKLVQARIQKNISEFAKQLDRQFKKDKLVATPPFDAKQFFRTVKAKAQQFATNGQGGNQSYASGITSALLSMTQQFPLTAHFLRIMESFSPQTLAHLPVGTRVVFSNHPTSLQLPMPESAQREIRIAIEENSAILQVFKAEGIDLSTIQVADVLAPVTSQDSIFISVKNNYGADIRATLRIFDSSGNMIVYTPWEFSSHDWFPVEKGPKEPITYGKLTPKAIDDFAGLASRGIHEPSEELRQNLRKPLIIDPLKIVLSPILDAIVPDKNIVASDDWLLSLPEFIYGHNDGSSVPSNIFTAFPTSSTTEVDESPTWLSLRTNYPANLLDQKIPRSSYDDVVQTISPDGLFDFVPSMRFAATMGPNGSMIEHLLLGFFTALGYGQDPFTANDQEWNVYRLTGSLDDGQLAQAETEQGLNLANLNSDGKEILKEILLARFMDDREYMGGAPNSGGFPASNINQEPTYAFAQSLPGAVFTISLRKSTEVSIPATLPGMSTPTPTFCDSISLGYQLAPTKYNLSVKYDLSQIKLYPDYTYTMTISFPGTNLAPITSGFETRSHNSKVYNGLKELPASIRDPAEAQMKKLENKGSGNSGG